LNSGPPAPKAGGPPNTTLLFSTLLLKQNNLAVIVACGWLCANMPICLLRGHKSWHISDGARLIVNFLTDDNIQKFSKPRRAPASDVRCDKNDATTLPRRERIPNFSFLLVVRFQHDLSLFQAVAPSRSGLWTDAEQRGKLYGVRQSVA
jgi:hypothetical protein